MFSVEISFYLVKVNLILYVHIAESVIFFPILIFFIELIWDFFWLDACMLFFFFLFKAYEIYVWCMDILLSCIQRLIFCYWSYMNIAYLLRLQIGTPYPTSKIFGFVCYTGLCDLFLWIAPSACNLQWNWSSYLMLKFLQWFY